jgi:hypothetical protein
MSVKAKIAAGAATFALVGGGLGMVGTLTASASTPSCAGCTSIFTQKYGPQYLVDVYQTKAAANQPIILFQSSNSDRAEDFVVKDLGTVHDYYDYNDSKQSDFSRGFEAAFGQDEVYEFQYEPYGVNSDYCLSTWPGEAPQPGYKVRLERCGQYANSLWAVDSGNEVTDDRSTDNTFAPTDEDVPLINGGDTSFSDPLVLNYPAGNPTDMPRPILNVQPENSYSDGTIYDNQEWGGLNGTDNSNNG